MRRLCWLHSEILGVGGGILKSLYIGRLRSMQGTKNAMGTGIVIATDAEHPTIKRQKALHF